MYNLQMERDSGLEQKKKVLTDKPQLLDLIGVSAILGIYRYWRTDLHRRQQYYDIQRLKAHRDIITHALSYFEDQLWEETFDDAVKRYIHPGKRPRW